MLAICQSKHPSLKSRELCRDGSSVGPKENGANWLLDRAMATTPREASLRLSPWSPINQRILNPTLAAASSLPTSTSQPAVFFSENNSAPATGQPNRVKLHRAAFRTRNCQVLIWKKTTSRGRSSNVYAVYPRWRARSNCCAHTSRTCFFS